MLSRTKSYRACWVALLAVAAALPAGAQIGDLRLPISLDADSTDYDGKNSMLMFRGLRLTQGNIGVEAESGRASKLDFEDSVWQFSGDVHIDTGDGRVRCDSADLQFSGHQLRAATIQGSPATFELRRPGSDEVTYAEAERLEYDFRDGIIEFSGDATIIEGGNQISSNFLVYNIREQRINAESAGNGDDKVKITYTPAANGDDAAEAAEGDTANDDTTPPDNDGGS